MTATAAVSQTSGLFEVDGMFTNILNMDSAAKRFIDISTEKAINLYEAGYVDNAIALCGEILSVFPDYDKVKLLLANIYRNAGRAEDAVLLLCKIPEQSLFHKDALFAIGMILVNRRDFAGGVEYFTRLLKLNDKHIESHNNLGLCLMELSRYEDAHRHFNRAIELAPDNAEAYNNLGNLFVRCWRLTEASDQYRRAIALKADYAGAYSNLGRIASYEGRLGDALDLFRKALQAQPGFRTAADNLLFVLNNSDKHTPEQIRDEHVCLADIYGHAVTDFSPRQQKTQGNKIRLGYVSADFRSHSVGFFIEPVLQNHSRDHFEVYCYDQAPVPDDATGRIKQLGWAWRTVYGCSDRDVADQIRSDAIDVLVDLSGHSDGNRLGVFALKPAPVQVTWLGYPNTTGLKQVDFRLTDELADPSGMTDHLYVERLVRLARTFLCYAPPVSAPEVAPLPEGAVVFCCFNNNPKISDTVLGLWARILRAIPGSKLFLKSGPLGDSGVRIRMINRFADLKIDASCLLLSGFTANREEHLQLYGRCHIALDTYPYHGTTTTCEALWMGLPVVTLAGASHAARVGVSILKNAGLSELIAPDADQYVKIAVSLAQSPDRLRNYRRSLRERLLASPLMDAGSFTADLERVYRGLLEPYPI